MNVAEFKRKMSEDAAKHMGLDEFSAYLKHDSRDDKQLREELLAIYAMIEHRDLDDDAEIQIGGEKHDFDACIAGEFIEITQALPNDEHEIRKSVATGSTTPLQHAKHWNDQEQFPDVIIDAINKKHDKCYADTRTLVVVFDGDYASEDDSIIEEWISAIQASTDKGSFDHVLLVERDRMKAFDVF